MTKKLTLALDNAVVCQAKKYAFRRKISLSRLVESYFTSLTSCEREKEEVLMPITSELFGMVNAKSIQDKGIIADFLIKKYL